MTKQNSKGLTKGIKKIEDTSSGVAIVNLERDRDMGKRDDGPCDKGRFVSVMVGRIRSSAKKGVSWKEGNLGHGGLPEFTFVSV